MRNRVGGVVSRRVEPDRALLVEILLCASDFYGFDAGIIYVADHDARTMRCAAFIGCDDLQIDPSEFVYSFDQRSAATTVLNREGFFSPHPRADPNVSPDGLDKFEIDGPLVALPLMVTAHVHGALVMWSRSGVTPTPSHASSLRPFALLAATCIAPWEAGRSEAQLAAALATIQQEPRRPRASLRDPKYVRLLFIGILAAGFKRVRVFRYGRDRRHSAKRFVCVASCESSGENQRRDIVIDPRTNRYAAHIVATFVSKAGAREYDPLSDRWFGEDPDAATLGKAPGQTWAVVPLVSQRRLYGQISADQGNPRREISEESLEYLTLVGDLVSRAIEHDRQRTAIDRRRAAQIKTQKQLENSERLYRSLVESVPMCILRKDLDGRFIYVNGSFCAMLGRDWPEIRGRTDADFYPPDLASAYIADDQKVMRTGRRHERIEAHSAPDRPPCKVHVIKTPVKDAEGRVEGVQCVFWQVGEPSPDALLGDTGELVCLLDIEGRFVQANQSFCETLGYAQDELECLMFHTLVAEGQRKRFSGLFDYSAVRHESSQARVDVVCRDRTPLALRVQSVPMMNVDQCTGVRLTARPLSKAEAEEPLDPTVFAAYRMNEQESKDFVDGLQARLAYSTPPVTLVVGHLPAGEWAPFIRDRIDESQLVVGDVTHMRKEVIFELGLAKGYGKEVLPVLAPDDDGSHVPQWLNRLQRHSYGRPEQMAQIASAITNYLARPRPPAKDSVEVKRRLALWVRLLPWNTDAFEQCRGQAHQNGLVWEHVDDPERDEERVTDRVSEASLLIVSLDYKPVDTLMHFLGGKLVARPRFPGDRADRCVVVLCRTHELMSTQVAQGLRDCENRGWVRVVTPDRAADEVRRFAAAHRP